MSEEINFSNGHTYTFTYDATGVLLNSTYTGDESRKVDNIGIVRYEDDEISFVWTPEGRALNTQSGYDYEYFLKDYLGNTRVVFGYQNITHVYRATMEDELSQEEEAEFVNMLERNSVYNHTQPNGKVTNPDESIEIGGNRTHMGPGKYLEVSSGDKISAEIWVRYNNTQSNTNNTLIADIASVITSGFGLSAGEAFNALNAQSSSMSLGVGYSATSSIPKSYLAYLTFDENYNFINSGHVAVDATSNGVFDVLSLSEIEMPTGAKHLYLYVVNESAVVPVFIDDFFIIHEQNQKGLVVSQSMDYYPFGMPIDGTSYINEGVLANYYGYQGKEYRSEDGLKLYDFHARQYDPALGRFLAVDPQGQFHSPYTGMGNNPVMMVDPDGELAWFVPVIIGAVVGGYSGASIQSGTWNPGQWDNDWYKGAITGALIGAASGAGVAAAIGPSGGITGMTVGNSTLATAELTKAWGIASTAIQSANVNMAITAIGGGDLDNVYKSGLVGLGSGAFTASGGFGMVNAWGSKSKALQFAGRQLYQGIGTAGRSIGNNWAMGRDPFSRVTVGAGPVNLTFGKGQKLLQWQNNIGNIGTNLFGLTNKAFGGSADFNWEHLTPTYGGGLIDKLFGGTWGAHSILYRTDQYSQEGNRLISHELHHIWQSRALGDSYLANYAGQGLLGLLMGRPFNFGYAAYYPNYFENQAYYYHWFKP